MTTRSPAVAGRFYEKSAPLLQKQLDDWVSPPATHCNLIRALIVPHAGYIYSGEVAAKAYCQLQPQAETIKKVILVGPSHRYAFHGCAVPNSRYFSTPLGSVSIDIQSIDNLIEIDDIKVSDQVHAQEHCLEVQLPFLQTCLHQFTLLPLLTSDISATQVAKIIGELWQQEDTLLVISSDLSHFHPYADAQCIDQNTCSTIERFEPSLTAEQACGSTGINALLLLAKKRGYQLTRMELKNSGDTAGDKERVVGYVSYLVSEIQ